MDYLFQDGGKPKKTKSKTKTTKSKTSTKTGTKTSKSKTSTKSGTKTTKSKTSTKKGGNFLGTVGDLVAPTGWGPFATAAGLLALDRADAALRRGKSEKSSVKKGGMRGGNEFDDKARIILENSNQDIVNKYQQNLTNAYKKEKQGPYIAADLYDELQEKINERKRLLDSVSDKNIKKRLESSIKRLEQKLVEEELKIYRGFKHAQQLYNTPNTPLNYFKAFGYNKN
jgi:hypothetical protein